MFDIVWQQKLSQYILDLDVWKQVKRLESILSIKILIEIKTYFVDIFSSLKVGLETVCKKFTIICKKQLQVFTLCLRRIQMARRHAYIWQIEKQIVD